MSHPNRSKNNPSQARNPKPEEILRLRLSAQLTPSEAAKLVHSSQVAWEQWETGERPMHPTFWRLFRQRTTRKTSVGGRLYAEVADPDAPNIHVVWLADRSRSIGAVAGPVDGAWACFYASNVGEKRPAGLDGAYRHHSIEDALRAFEPLLD